MSQQDKLKWNRKHGSGEFASGDADEFLEANRELLGGGRALDIAAGTGSNTLYLAEQGYEVDAVDISSVAMQRLMNKADKTKLSVRCIVADLDSFFLPYNYYDLVVVFYFFSPELMPSISRTVVLGGLLIYATYNEQHLKVRPHFNNDFLVQPGELQGAFPHFYSLHVDDRAGPVGNISRFVDAKRFRVRFLQNQSATSPDPRQCPAHV